MYRLKDILYPTLLCAIFKSSRNFDILNQEMSMDHLEKYLQYQLQLYPFEQIQEEGKENSVCGDCKNISPENMNNIRDFMNKEYRLKRPLSVSSNNSSTTSLFTTKCSMSTNFQLIARIPRDLWEDLLNFLQCQSI